MLSKWSVENFKSVSGRVDLTLRPLTIFAGANSSGKSTIIQSILLTKQTFKDSPSNRALALNGPILKLGRFDDVKHIQTTDDFISFGCVMDFYTWVPIPDPDNFANYLRYYYGRARDKFRTISFDCRFDVIGSSELAQLQPTLKSTEIAARERRETPITEFSGGLAVISWCR